jgi:dihydropteroate synthase
MRKEAETRRSNLPRWILEGNGIRLELGRRTLVMGVLNITPDSFSDGGAFLAPDQALAHAERMAADGADLIDIGGESSRPGARSVPVDEELQRVIPVIERISKAVAVPLSIDTSKAEVARQALSAGASIINDITALRGDAGMARVAAEAEAPVVLMHMQGNPRTMQNRPTYRSLIGDIAEFFEDRLAALDKAGIPRDRVVLDPGLGFGKTVDHNLEIIRSLERFSRMGRPLLVGPSRKSFVGRVLDLPVGERLEGTAAAVTAAVLNGASVIRVHDVREMVRVIRMADSIKYGVTVAG